LCRVPPSWKNKIKKGPEISSQAQPIHVESQKTTGRKLDDSISSIVDPIVDQITTAIETQFDANIQPYLTLAEAQIEAFIQSLGWGSFNIPDSTEDAEDAEEQACSYLDIALGFLPETDNNVDLFLSLGFLGSILALVCAIII